MDLLVAIRAWFPVAGLVAFLWIPAFAGITEGSPEWRRRNIRFRAALPYIRKRNRRAESGGFALLGNPLPYQDHVDFAGAVDAGYYFVLDVGGAAGAGYQVHVAAERVGGVGGAAEGEELV